jgi:hypothetical protein
VALGVLNLEILVKMEALVVEELQVIVLQQMVVQELQHKALVVVVETQQEVVLLDKEQLVEVEELDPLE